MLDVPTQCYASGIEKWHTPTLNINKAELKPLQQYYNSATRQEQASLTDLAPVMLAAGTTSLASIKTTFQSNTVYLTELVQHYNDFKANTITKGQYDYRRKKVINQLDEKLGPLRYALNKSQTSREILRVSRKRGRRPTGNITRQIARMNKLSKLAHSGGILLAGVGLGLACHDIAHADSALQKNHILVESLGGVFGGVVFGGAVALTLALIATPVGWVAALMIGAGGVAVSYATGAIFKSIYDTNMMQVDLAQISGVSHLCR